MAEYLKEIKVESPSWKVDENYEEWLGYGPQDNLK